MSHKSVMGFIRRSLTMRDEDELENLLLHVICISSGDWVCGFRPKSTRCCLFRHFFILRKRKQRSKRGRPLHIMASDDESASPSRRSSRKRVPVNYSDNVIKIIEQEVKPETRKRRHSPSKLRTSATRGRPRIQNDENDDDGHKEEAIDPEEDDDESLEDTPVKKRKAIKKGKATKKGRGPESRRTCEFCDKVCVSMSGLKYHVDNFVCRPELKSNEDSVSHSTSNHEKESVAEEESDREKDDDSEEEIRVKKSKVSKKGKGSKHGRGPESERTCEFCDKVCISKNGLKYHVDNFVCRPALKEKKAAGKRGRKRSSAAVDDKSSQGKAKKIAGKRGRKCSTTGGDDKNSPDKTGKARHRGSLNDRTCSNCKRVFTSEIGLKYHVDHNVCVDAKKKTNKMTDTMPYPPLVPGRKYVTLFGVVEIVADNRAIPNPVATTKKASSSYLSNGRGRSRTQVFQASAIKTRVRRERLLRLYENDRMEQKAVWRAYDVDLQRPMVKKKKPAAPEPDPVDESFPDRIVECVLIPDKRTFIKGDEDDSDNNTEGAAVRVSSSAVQQPGPSPYGAKLFLRRSMIEEIYAPSTSVHVCDDCGQHFGSQSGYVYHVRGQVCITKNKRRAAALCQQLKAVEEKLVNALKRVDRPNRRAKARDCAVYPQVWLSLGFEFLPKTLAGREEAIQSVQKQEDLKPPDELLSRLRNELRRNRDRMLGAVYPAVFESLQFQRPPPWWKDEQEKAKQARRKVKLEQQKLLRELERQKNPPPIIDIRVLADEADSGRYPSMKRYSGEHRDFCSICKNGGTLLCCDFCPEVVHIECIRTKHTIKDPEPQDDFMCHHCIQCIMCRRNRAEKRRIMKQTAALKRGGQDLPVVASGAEDEFASDYHAVAALGHELRDISELMGDAKVRLRLAIGRAKMNEIRRSVLGP